MKEKRVSSHLQKMATDVKICTAEWKEIWLLVFDIIKSKWLVQPRMDKEVSFEAFLCLSRSLNYFPFFLCFVFQQCYLVVISNSKHIKSVGMGYKATSYVLVCNFDTTMSERKGEVGFWTIVWLYRISVFHTYNPMNRVCVCVCFMGPSKCSYRLSVTLLGSKSAYPKVGENLVLSYFFCAPKHVYNLFKGEATCYQY